MVVLLGLLGALASPVAAQTPPSTDATLSGLELSEGRLDLPFAGSTTDYTAAVGYTVTRITVSPTRNDANAALEFLDGGDNPLPDADGSTDEQDVDLVVGETVVKVQVTAEDTSTVLTYTVTITRTEEDTSLSPPASDPVAASPSTAVYTVTFKGDWSTSVTPGGVPSGAHFSRLIGGVHSDAVTFLESGGTASAGVESMAEVGGWTGLQGEVQDAGTVALNVLSGDTDFISPTTSKTLTATLTTEHPRITLVTMVAPSPDWFVGVSGLPLLDDQGHWLRAHEVHLYPWDAGTEDGGEFSLSNPATSPHGVITSIRGTGKFSTEPIASLSFALRSVSTTRSVAENTAAGVDIGSPVTATAVGGTVTYTLGGTDTASFDIVPSTGQLQTKAALDYATKSSYEVTVTATDTDGSVTTTVAIEVTDVIELTTFSGPTMVTFAENGATRVATFSYSSDEDRDGIEWLAGGVDRGLFSLDSPSGALRFLQAPDFENPLDVGPPGRGTNNMYELKLVAWARDNGSIFTDEVDVKVTVTDVDEAGALSLSSTRPALGAVLTAVLTDPDGATAGTAVWQWERSTGRNLWAVIDGAAAASYTPVAADTNTFLRVTATYADEHGTGKSVSEVAPNVVTGPLLTGLTAETDDSQANTARRLYPAFDPQTLHYGIGCNSTDTLVLTVSAAADARVAVAGVQAAGAPEAVSVAVSTDSDVAIRVTDASGAGTTYVVHCLSDVFFQIETVTYPGTDLLEDLILFSRSGYFTLMDRNGVPRLRRAHSNLGGFAIRFYRIGIDGAYRYGFGNNSGFTVLDEDFEVVEDNVSTVGSSLTPINPHDFQILENGNYLLTANPEVMGDFRDFDLPSPADGGVDLSSVAVWDQTIQIVTPGPGPQAVFTWGSWGNIAAEDCVQHRFPVTLSTDPQARPADTDISHFNGAHMVDGVVAVSLRGCSKVLGIDVASGDVVWRMGRTNLSDAEWAARDIGPRPLDFINDPEGEFCGQHSARILPNGNVFLFDNGSVCVIDPWTFEELGREGSDFSRAVEYALDLENHEAVFVRDHSLRGTRDHLGYANGTVFALDNGDWLVSWGRPLDVNVPIPDNERATLVDPATGQEKLGLRFRELPASHRSRRINATVAPAEALAPQPVPLTAEFPASAHTSLFHAGAGDAPQVVVAFNQPVVDLSVSSPSISVTGATVASVSAHLVAGEPANAYLVTLTPDGDGAISFLLDTGQACGDGGICTADGTTLAEAPAALVIGPAVTVSFEQATHTVTEGTSRSVAVRLSSAHQGVRSVTIPVVLQNTGSASADDLTLDESVTFEAGETSKPLALNATDDDLVEGPEAATLEFGTLPDGVTAGSTSTVTLTLTDADQADISFSVGANQIAEGGETQLSFAITNTNPVTFEVDQAINLTVGGTATESDDFTLANAGGQILSAPHSIAFPAGATAVSATLRAVDDFDIEPAAESITVDAWLALTNTSLGSRTITIPASDVPDTPVVTIAAGGAVSEGQDATFTLSRTASINLPLSDPLTVSVEVTATGSTLGGSPTTAVRFEGGDATADLDVLTRDDSVVEPPGTVTALIQGSTTNPPVYLTSAINSATVTVTDNDMAAFMFSAGATEVAEGSTVQLTITADGVTFAEPQMIALALGGTATPADDFTLSDGVGELLALYEVTLPAHAGAVAVTVRAARDDEDDAAETIEVSASHDGDAIGSVTITITEVPLPPVIFTGGGGGGASGPTPSDLDFEWNVTRDIEELDAGHGDPTGAWSDGVTLWLLENGSGADDAVYAYDLESGERVEELEFELDAGNLAPRGLWSDGSTTWISDSGKDKLFAHDLASGERLPDSDLALHPDNDDPRGIWSDGATMWVLDGRDNALFGYDLASGDLLAAYALDDDNDDPHGIWSDGVGVWVSDHNDKRLFAYRLPVPDAEEVEGEALELELERVTDEEFTKLSSASNNSPRGLWSDGDVMYVADASDGKVYSYNMPDAIDARLASLTLSGVDFGEFSGSQTEYQGVASEGATETTLAASPAQRRATVVVEPADRDVVAEGHQAAVADGTEVTVTVKSADESRARVYRVRLGDAAEEESAAEASAAEASAAEASEQQSAAACLRGAVAAGFSLVVSAGGSVDELVACAEDRRVTSLYTLDDGAWVSYIVGAPGFVNERFGELYAEGLPAPTPLIAQSEGPPSADPAGGVAVVTESWPDCLRGELAAGFNLVLYEGGSADDLDACAASREVTAVYALVEGEYVPYILGAPELVNRRFGELFADGLAPATPLLARHDSPAPRADGGAGADDAAEEAP